MKTIQNKKVLIAIPSDLLRQVDALAERAYTSRSDVIRQALLDRVRHFQTDEWGDPVGDWKTTIDFRQINQNGVPAKQLLEALHRLSQQDHQ